MPQPCTVSTTTINLTTNGSPAVLQADARLSGQSNRLLVASDGLQVRDWNLRLERATNGAVMTAASSNTLLFDKVVYASPAMAAQAAAMVALPGTITIIPGWEGVWRITTGFATDGAATVGNRPFQDIRINGTQVAVYVRPLVTGETSYIGQVFTEQKLVVGDTVGGTYVNNDTVNRFLVAGPLNHFTMSYIGPGT